MDTNAIAEKYADKTPTTLFEHGLNDGQMEIVCEVNIKAIWNIPPKSAIEKIHQDKLNVTLHAYALRAERQIESFVKSNLQKMGENPEIIL